jgi:tRNA(fMet)-specific endonuclease VapC
VSYLLDSNMWIALLRWRNADVLTRLKQHPPEEILLCSVVLAELWYGAENSHANHRDKNYAVVNELESQYRSLDFDTLAARDYALIRAQLASAGRPIGPYDTMIAAIARSQNAILVTNNTAEFVRVPGLSLENWQLATH